MNLYFKIAWRNFLHNKFYGIINIIGLAVGLAGCFLIMLYLQKELGYDQFLKDNDRIYQVVLSASFGGDEFQTSNTPPPVGDALQSTFPEIESFTRHYMPGDLAVRYEDESYTESNIWLVDSNFLDFFSFPLLEGDRTNPLKGTRSIVLTRRMANKYFGDSPAIGKNIYLEEEPYTVTAILDDLPAQSSLQFDALAPIAASDRVAYFSWSWVWLQVDTYVRLKRPLKTEALAALEGKFPEMVRQRAAPAFERIGQNLEEYFQEGNRWELSLNPLADIHLRSPEISSRLNTKSNITDVYIFGTVGLFLLLLAAINFMNLTTARASRRAQEVGIRKVLGSNRSTLIQQFLSEATSYSLVAAIVAVVLVRLTLPAFNQMMNQSLQFSELFAGWTLLAVLVLPILTGFLAGSYPAFFISRFQPIKVLKGKSAMLLSGKDSFIRNGLVVFQFTISLVLIICTWIVLQQIHFSVNSDLGMDKENVIILPNAQYLGGQKRSFKNELQELPEVKYASISSDVPIVGNVFSDFYIPEMEGENTNVIEDLTLYSYLVDEEFVPAMGIEIVEGRNFDKTRALDSTAVIINESTVDLIGWENPIGKYLTYPGGNYQRYEVIGVMKDFHNASFRLSIEPFALFRESAEAYQLPHSFVVAKLETGTERLVLDKIQSLWSDFAPAAPFSFTFLDESVNGQYQAEERFSSVLSAFTLLSIFVACLGLLGLITYTAEQRNKEIGIRKVLGANVFSILGLLSKDFLVLIVIALAVASPIAYYFMYQWLADFAYRVDIQWWVFVFAGLLALAIAFIVIGFQGAKAALANPIEALRSEQ